MDPGDVSLHKNCLALWGVGKAELFKKNSFVFFAYRILFILYFFFSQESPSSLLSSFPQACSVGTIHAQSLSYQVGKALLTKFSLSH